MPNINAPGAWTTDSPTLQVDLSDPYAKAWMWKEIDPAIGEALTDPVEIERHRLVDCIVDCDKTLRPMLADLLSLPIEDIRLAFQNRIPRRRRRAYKLEQAAKRDRQPVRLADRGVLTQDWCLHQGKLARVERWRSWSGDTPIDTEHVIVTTSTWVSWAGKRVRAEQILYALQHPEYALPNGTVRRRPHVRRVTSGTQSSDTP